MAGSILVSRWVFFSGPFDQWEIPASRVFCRRARWLQRQLLPVSSLQVLLSKGFKDLNQRFHLQQWFEVDLNIFFRFEGSPVSPFVKAHKFHLALPGLKWRAGNTSISLKGGQQKHLQTYSIEKLPCSSNWPTRMSHLKGRQNKHKALLYQSLCSKDRYHNQQAP